MDKVSALAKVMLRGFIYGYRLGQGKYNFENLVDGEVEAEITHCPKILEEYERKVKDILNG